MNTTTFELDILHMPDEMKHGQDHDGNRPLPLLDEVLHEIGPLPREALFLGYAEDESPILLDLHDPTPGPVLIVGGHATGKTDLLRMLAQFTISTHTPGEMQFAVVTNRVEEWQDRLSDAPHCVGIFSSQGPDIRRFVHSLALWIAEIRRPKQSVLVLMDGFDNILHWDDKSLACWRYVLQQGPQKWVWPVVTVNSQCDAQMQRWLELFRVKILAYDLIHGNLEGGNMGRVARNPFLSQVPWFSIKENGKWIDFWIPALKF